MKDFNRLMNVETVVSQFENLRRESYKQYSNLSELNAVHDTIERCKEILQAEYVRQNLPAPDIQLIIDLAHNDQNISGGAAMLAPNGNWYWTYNGEKTEIVPYTVVGWTYVDEIK